MQGLAPEVVPSTFAEDLDPLSYENVYEYPVATAIEKVCTNPNLRNQIMFLAFPQGGGGL